MEVKSVYLDLQEGVKNGNVWRLESEAFKDPIEIKIGYDNKELAEFKNRFEGIEKVLKAQEETNIATEEELNERIEHEVQSKKELQSARDDTRILEMRVDQNEKEKTELYKMIADLKTTVETHSGTILHLQEQIKLLEKKTTKQPSVFHGKCFISGRESAGLGMFELPDGDYLLNAKYTIGEHNEYVTNKDDIVFEKIHVEGQRYVPFYKLEGGTELDTPTATIYYDLVFMPI